MELLADFLDLYDKEKKTGSDESQRDLRQWAANLREFGVDGRYQRRRKT